MADKFVFVCPGLAPQWSSMGMELYDSEPVYRESLELCDKLFGKFTGWSILEEIKREPAESKLKHGRYAAPCVAAVQIALCQLLKEKGFAPSAVIGHSGGEIAAAYVAGALSLEDAMLLLYGYHELMLKIEGQGLLAHIGLESKQVMDFIKKEGFDAAIIGDNSPRSSLIGGVEGDIVEITRRFMEMDVFAREIFAGISFHTRYVAPHQSMLYDLFKSIVPQQTGVNIYSSVFGKKIEYDSLAPYYWVIAPREPISFHLAVRAAIDDGGRDFLELSPHPIMAGYIEEIFDSVNIPERSVIPSLIRDKSDRECFDACIDELKKTRDRKDKSARQISAKPQREPIPDEDILQRIIEISREILDDEQIAEEQIHQGFIQIGFTSLNAIDLQKRLEAEFDVSLPATLIFDYPSVQQVAQLVSAKLSGTETGVPMEDRYPGLDEEAWREPIAVIGLSCRMPAGGNSPEEFWTFLMNKGDSCSKVPEDRFDMSEYYSPDPDAEGKSITEYAHFLSGFGFYDFDPAFFGISPKEAISLDPQQRILIQTVWEALENAGMPPSKLKGKNVASYLAQCGSDNQGRHIWSWDFKQMDMYSATSSFASSAGGRVSFVFDLKGPNVSVDTACSSTLVALHVSVKALRSRECEMALTCAANLIYRPNMFIAFSKLGAMSPDGKSKAFDDSADGFGRGEGVGAVVLKRLSDALRDGDNIQAVIYGTALNQDGTSSSLTAPHGPSQEEVIHRALRDANLNTSDVDFVESHGTGTELGDAVELIALDNAFKQGREGNRKLYVGSVKSNIGHLEGAAGLASIVKTVLALKHETIPANIHFHTPNSKFDWEKGCIEVPTEHITWNRSERKRIAGMSGYGFSGTNAHAIIGEAPLIERKANDVDRPLHLLPISAKDSKALDDLAFKYARFFEREPKLDLGDVCFTASAGRDHFNHRLCLTGATIGEVKDKLDEYVEKGKSKKVMTGNAKGKIPPIVFLYSGQGSQYPGMTKDLYNAYQPYRDALDRIDKLFQPHLNASLVEIFFSESEDRELVNRTDFTQPAIFAVQCALTEMFQSWGIKPDAVAGHSIGEYAAAITAGIMSLEDAAELVAARGRLMHGAPGKGAMGVVFADEEVVRKHVEPYSDKISVAAINAPKTITISGAEAELLEILKEFKDIGVKSTQLTVSHAFHSPLMEPILDEFRQIAEKVEYSNPKVRFISCLTGMEETEIFTSAGYWTDHIRQPVLFQAGYQALESAEFSRFLEIGANTTLSGLASRCSENPDTVILPALRKKDANDWMTLLNSVGSLYANGFNPDWEAFDAPFYRYKIELPTYAFQGKRYWTPYRTKPTEEEMAGSSVIANRKQFLGVKLASPALDGTIVFQNRYSPKTHQFLEDHVIGDREIFPGAGMISLFFSAIKAAYGVCSGYFRDFTFLNLMKFQNDRSLDAQVILRKNGGEIHIQLVSADPEISGEWTLHSECYFVLDSKKAETEDAIEPYQIVDAYEKGKYKKRDHEYLYSSLRAAGTSFGPSFRLIRDWRSEEKAQSNIQLRDELKDGVEYEIYPGVIDALIVTTFAKWDLLDFFEREKQAIIPYAVDKIRFYQDSGTTELDCISHTRNVKNSLFGDMDAYTNDGRLFMQFRGFHGRLGKTEDLKKPDLTEVVKYFHRVDWVEKEREQSDESESQEWLLVNQGENGLAEKVRRTLERAGHKVTMVDKDGFTAETASESIAGIAYFATDLDDSGHTDVPQKIRKLLEDLLGFTKMLILNGYQRRLCIVTQDAQPQSSEIEPNLAKTSLWGYGLTLEQEYPDIDLALIDLPEFPADSEIEELTKELPAQSDDNQIIIRDSKRSVGKFASAPVGKTPEQMDGLFRSDSSYLITGGTGGLGLALAGWMVENSAVHIVLTDIKDENEIDVDFEKLANGKDVKFAYIRCNAADEDSVDRMFSRIDSEMPALKGVFHLAGVLDDGMIKDMKLENIDRVLGPKADGAYYLHKATETMDLDYFVLFSSVASVTGSPAQANYSAANRFLDALADYRRVKGLAGTAVNWGPWKDAGMAAVTDRRGKRMEEMGITSLGAAVNFTALEKILWEDLNNISVTQINWQKYNRTLSEKDRNGFFSNFKQDVKPIEQEEESAGALDLSVQLEEAPPEQARSVLTDNVSQIAADVIGIAAEDLDPEQPLTDQGYDSLSAVELRNQLGKAVGKSLPVSLIFDFPTVKDVVNFLAADVFELTGDKKESAETDAGASETEILDNIEQLIKGS